MARDACGSPANRRIGHPASFARRPDKVNSHPIPYTQTDIRKMATQIDASSDAAATAAAQHTPMMQRSFCHT
ncbi:DNA mismatch repair protein [Burkholderia thailandensis]|nr:DNA mismatch repair protein [Burkholderia thailandensis]AWY66529.1 DNA mismatch repair protein [Burkholderia thailandensis]NOK42585.1 DNA mismatch repair protein [Burkholderia thailandensis]